MAVTTQELYDWLLVNWGNKMSFKRGSSLPATPEGNTLYLDTTDKKFSYWNGTEWQPIGGGVADLHFIIEGDLDTVSASVTLKGPIKKIVTQQSFELTSHSFQAKLDASTSYTDSANIAALELWIASNVVSATTVWQLRVLAVYKSTHSGQASVLVTYEK